MRRISVAMFVGLVFGASCAGQGHIDCAGPPEWETVEATVLEVGGVRQTDDQPAAQVLIQDESGVGREISVWGAPDKLEVGAAYRFEVAKNDEAFFGYSGKPECYEPFRESVELGA